MSAPTNTGGPAFPRPCFDNGQTWNDDQQGMTLRDYFAAKAMQAELLTCGVPGQACDALVQAIAKTGETPEQHMARCAYEMADAMLAARGDA